MSDGISHPNGGLKFKKEDKEPVFSYSNIETYFRTYGIPAPISEARVIECKHGFFGWDVCEDCAVEQILIDFKSRQLLVQSKQI